MFYHNRFVEATNHRVTEAYGLDVVIGFSKCSLWLGSIKRHLDSLSVPYSNFNFVVSTLCFQ